MYEKINLFLFGKAKKILDKTIKQLNENNTEKLDDSEKREYVLMILKVLFLLSPVIFEGLLRLSLKSLFRRLLSSNKNIYLPYGSFLLSIANFLYSSQNFENVFKPIVSDWREESFEALSKKEIGKARWINARYTYAFLAAMWQKSPIGDLIEFIRKIAK